MILDAFLKQLLPMLNIFIVAANIEESFCPIYYEQIPAAILNKM